ncbi:MAG: hypothetical protein ACLUD0_17105 [Eubacterium ramulus]
MSGCQQYRAGIRATNTSGQIALMPDQEDVEDLGGTSYDLEAIPVCLQIGSELL